MISSFCQTNYFFYRTVGNSKKKVKRKKAISKGISSLSKKNKLIFETRSEIDILAGSSSDMTISSGVSLDNIFPAENYPANPFNIKAGDIVWGKMAGCPWWPAKVFTIYSLDISPISQSCCVLWIQDSADEHGYVNLTCQVEPFIQCFQV